MNASAVPRVVWMLWLQGWESAPPLVRACLDSWRSWNPGWEIRPLTKESLADYIDDDEALPIGRDGLPPAARSDLIRLALLREHGGVWVDSTVHCAKALDDWLPEFLVSGFFGFDRPGPDRMISTWFLAAAPHHYLIEEWSRSACNYWADRMRADAYYWAHYLFGDAYERDAEFRMLWDATPKISADGPHYFVPYKDTLLHPLRPEQKERVLSGSDPMYKLTRHIDGSAAPAGSVYDYFASDGPAPR